MRTRIVLSILVLGIALFPSTASACYTIEAWNFMAPGANFSTNGNWTFGEVFVPQVAMYVTYLGYYAPFGPGSFMSDHPVGIYDAAGHLIVSTVIDNSSHYGDLEVPRIGDLGGNFLFNPVSFVLLQAGHTYVLEGVSGADPYTWDDFDFTVFPNLAPYNLPISVVGNNWVLNGGLSFNGTTVINNVGDGYWGPNFGVYVVPEPGTIALLAGGMLAVSAGLRRKLTF